MLSESGPATASLSYDPLGRLNQTTINGATTTFLYAGSNLVAEYSGGAILRRYVFGSGIDEPLIWYEGSGLTDRRYLHQDRQGSVIAYSNGAGTVPATYTYDPYGIPNVWGGSRFRYTGQIEIPEAQLYYYKARVYDPASGRFLQTDPVGISDDLNLYAYVGDDPVDQSDPSGLESASIAIGCDGPCNRGPTEAEARAFANFALDTLPITGETRALGSFVRRPTVTGAIVLGASFVDLGGVARAARGIFGEAARGGTYVLRDADGAVMRSGRTKDFVRREKEHARAEDTRALTFERVHRTDSLVEQRGLEQHLHDTYKPPMNKIRPVSPRNPRAAKYSDAASDFLRRN